jgi:hypothetical protein
MTNLNYFMFGPGGEHESGKTSSQKPEDNMVDPAKNPEGKEDKEVHKSIKEKIKEALQDWSNKDERDQEYDDTKV